MATIQAIRLKGFKSFPKLIEIPFGNCYNVILGPNGSGKSNIMDAFTFVLGKTSARAMRAEKSANLIFHGGKKGAPAKEAEVDIIFNNDNKSFSLKDKEIKISRAVKQSGQSTYKINDNVVTRQQVVDLLASAKIDPDSHNIILQGDIVSFMEMRPEDRRKLVEDVAGISVYEDKKEKAMSELLKVDTKLNEANIILTERDTYMKELKKDRDQAKKYKELEENIRSSKATYIHLQMKSRQEKLDEFNKRIQSQNDQKEKILKEIVDIKKSIEEKKQELSQINKDVESRGEVEQKKLHHDIESLKTEEVRQSSRLEVCKSEIEKISSRKKQLEKNLEEAKQKIISLNSEKKELLSKESSLKSEEKKLDAEMQKFRDHHQLGDVSSLDKLDVEYEQTEKSVAKLQEEKQKLLRESDKINFELNQLNPPGDKEKFKEVKDVKNKFRDISTTLSKALSENSSLVVQLSNARKKMFEADEKLQKVAMQNASFKDAAGMDIGIKKILDLKDKGVHGTISSLGKVSSKYAIALEVAAGARLKSVVVDSDVTAARCINVLKNERLGVVTFLPLNKMKERIPDASTNQLKGSLGVLGKAIDLVDFEKKFSTVFSYVFGDTLIVEDMNTARKIGVGRARMVTLDGDLLEPSGAMVGGFRRKTFGGFKQKDLDEDVSRFEKEVSDARKLVDLLESRTEDNTELVQKLREEKAVLEADILKFERAYGVEDLDAVQEKQSALRDAVKEIEKSLRTIDADLSKATQQVQKIREAREKAKHALKDDAVLKSLETLERDRAKVREQLMQISLAIKNCDQQSTELYAPELAKIQKIMDDSLRESQTFSKEASALEVQLKSLSKELKEKEYSEKKFYADFKDLFAKRNKIAELVQKLETTSVREEERARSVEQRTQSIELDRAKVVAEIAGLEEEFKEFKDEKLRRNMSFEQLKDEIKEFEHVLKNLGSVNLRALEVYESAEKEYHEILEKVSTLQSEKDDVLSLITDIDSKKKELFMKTFHKLGKNFRDIFSQLSTKGEAHLMIEDEENLFESGLDIQVRITGNKFLDIKSLSGGEKTMAALAFIFAIQEFEPAAFYLLDEVDAALDKRNSELLSKLIKKYSQHAQYIVVSHNDLVITEADQVYGVSMQEMVSKVISLKL